MQLVAFLYIDPGAGSMVIQAALAAVLAIPFFLRGQIERVVDRLRGPRLAQRGHVRRLLTGAAR